MLQSIIQFSIRNKLIVILAVIGLVVHGAYSVTKLPIDAVPDITNNQVMVITSSPSLGAADIERLLTVPIEQYTRNIPGIVEQRSFSRFGLSLVTIVFDDNTDVYWARQQVGERLVQVQNLIPAGLGTPEMGPVSTGLGEIYQYVVRTKAEYRGRYDAMELRSIQDWIVRRQLLGTDGVADVSSFGGKLKQYEVSVDPEKLHSHNLSMTEVFTALEANNQNTGGAYIEKGPTILSIRSEGLVTSLSDIEEIVVGHLPDHSPILVRDIAQVGFGHATRYGAMTFNAEGEVAGGVVMMLKGANSSEVITNVKKKIESIQKTLPEGVEIEAFLDRTKMVNNALHTVITNLSEGAVIVIFILVLFLGNLRAGILVASVIPLSMLFAIIMMNATGVSGNLMSLGALDFGLIVDGSVIVVETILHRLHHNRLFAGMTEVDQDTMNAEVEHSSAKIMKSAVFGQLIILIVYLPFFVLEGIEGKMFKPMAQTVSYAIIGAFLLSVTYVPMMSSLILSKKISNKRTLADRMMDSIHAFYEPQLKWVLERPRAAVASVVVLLLLSLGVLATLGAEFIPKLEEGDFAVESRVLTGSSLNTSIKATQQASAILQQYPEVEKVVTKIGSGEIPTDPMPIEAADMMIILKPKSEWTTAHSFNELAEHMSTALRDVPGLSTGFQYPVQMRFNELMTGARQDVVCKIYGDNLDSLVSLAERLGTICSGIDGACDLYVESVGGLPQIVATYNRSALAQYGVSVREVNRCLESAFAGAVAGQVYEQERRFDMVLRLDRDKRQDIEDVRNLLVQGANGQQFPLRQLADVRLLVGPNQIQRDNAQRRITIGFNVRGRDVQSIVHDLQEAVNAKLKFPAGYSISYGGQFENLNAAKQRLSISVPVSLLLIFLLLYIAFNSIRYGLLIYSGIPLAAIGGILALWVFGMPFSISAAIGFIALFGVAVLNGIVLISEFVALKDSGVHDIMSRILKGTRIRLRPVLMTASVASLGFLPMALSRGAGAEVQRPLATVVIGGLITTTLLTMMILPALYLLFETQYRKPDTRPFGFIRRRMQKRPPPAAAILLFFVSFSSLQAQQLSLIAAQDTALKNNAGLRSMELRHKATVANQGTAWDLPATSISAEFGALNSDRNDTKLNLSQGFDLPFVYSREATLRARESELSAVDRDAAILSLRQDVQRCFYAIRVQRERVRILKRSDSVFSQLARSQQDRFAAGDNTSIEVGAARAAAQHSRFQLNSATLALLESEREFRRLLFGTQDLSPEDGDPLMSEPDSLGLSANQSALVRRSDSRLLIAQSTVDVQQARRYPQLFVGYTNQSFNGSTKYGSSSLYGTGDRFQSWNVGLNLPLFYGAGSARAESAEWNKSAAEFAVEDARHTAEYELFTRRQNLSLHREHLAYYRGGVLTQAQDLLEHADRAFASGDINLQEYCFLHQQSLTIQLDYLHAVEQWNATIIDLLPFHRN